MKRRHAMQVAAAAALMAAAMWTNAADSKSLVNSDNRDKSIPTVITSDKLDFDYEELVALFDGRVFIKDQQFTLKADRMIVFFEKENNEIKRVDASGNVKLVSGDMTATCGKATYTRKNGQVIIQVNPVVTKGDNKITGNKMSVWLDDQRVVVEESVALEARPSN